MSDVSVATLVTLMQRILDEQRAMIEEMRLFRKHLMATYHELAGIIDDLEAERADRLEFRARLSDEFLIEKGPLQPS